MTRYLSEHGGKQVTNGMLQIKAKGDWTVTIKRVTETSTRNLKGQGTMVTGLFKVTGGRNVIRLTHDGSHNFIVKVYQENGGRYDYELLVNEIGAYSGEKIVNLKSGINYFVEIRADGNWTVDFGYGDAVTQYSNPAIGGSGGNSGGNSGDNSGGNSGSETESDPTLWSFSEAQDLNTNAQKATDGMNECVTYLNKGANAGAMLTPSYYTMAVSKCGVVVGYLERMQVLAKENKSLNLTSGDFATLLDMIEDTLAKARVFADRQIDSNNLPAFSDISRDAMNIYTQCLGIQKLSVDLLKAFTD
jgi:hypothetical protein